MSQQSPSSVETAPSEGRATLLWSVGRATCRIYTTLAFDLHVHGAEHIPDRGGALLISNHQSFLDPILLAVQLRRMVSYMARSTLFENPQFSWLIRSLHAFPVRRGESDVSAIKEAIRRLREGRILALFPEGTRSGDGQLGRIQPGIAMIVRRAGVPVIPAVIDGAWQAWPRCSKLPRPHPIRVLYGPSLQIDELRPEGITTLIDTTLRSMLRQLREMPGRR